MISPVHSDFRNNLSSRGFFVPWIEACVVTRNASPPG